MNNTTKAKYELAERMLKGKVDIDEVVMMTGLTTEEVEKLKEQVVPKNTEAEILEKLGTVDFGQILFDDTPPEEAFSLDFQGQMPGAAPREVAPTEGSDNTDNQ